MKFDFEDFQPMIFTVDVRFGQTKGDQGTGSVSINDRPFIIQKITHQLINPTRDGTDPNMSVQALQDGLYRINWSLYNQVRYFQGPVPMADTAFGSIRHGIFYDLPVPVALEKNRTLNVEVTNEVDRDPLVKAYQLHIEFQGIEDLRQQTQ